VGEASGWGRGGVMGEETAGFVEERRGGEVKTHGRSGKEIKWGKETTTQRMSSAFTIEN